MREQTAEPVRYLLSRAATAAQRISGVQQRFFDKD